MQAQRLPRPRGFSLIELLVTIVVLGVLMSVALPIFMDSIRKSRRAEAFTALNAVQQAQERWRANNAQYADSTRLTPLATDSPPGLGLSATTPTGYYAIAIANDSATGYDVTATAVTGKSQEADKDCAKMGLRMSGGNLLYAGTSSTGTLAYAASNKCWSR